MTTNKTLLLALALTVQVATASAASIVDAPHTGVHGVNCKSCHSYSLWWRYSPTNQSLTPSRGEIVNAVCNNCHDGSKPGIPAQHTHSSTVIGSSLHGTWKSDCIACHDPHFQGQLQWVTPASQSYPAGLYVIQGTIGAVAAGAVAGTTDLAYGNVPADNLSGDWTDRSRWGKKNDNQDQDRGLILVVDAGRAENTFQVISANDTVITVKGSVNPAASGKTFGLLYGQLIRKVIATPASGNRQVTFFNPDTLYSAGGYTDQEPTRQGVCQVCHTQTSHWTQDGLQDNHNPTLKCSHCHDMVQGFKPSLPAHSFLSDTTPCTNCHQHPAGNPLALHGNLCQTCHTTPPRLRTDLANLAQVTRLGLDPNGTVLANGKTATSCTYCHSAYFGGHAHDHSATVAVNAGSTPLTANCQGCHPASASPFVGAGQVHAGSGCATCHDLAANGSLRGSAASATAPYGECVACHAGYFAGHDHGAAGGSREHSVGLGSDTLAGTPCAACHNGSGGGLASWNDILVEHKSDCGLCHNSGRTTNLRAPYTSVAEVIAQADAQHPVTCLDCHLSHGNDHQTLYVSAYEDGGQPVPSILTTCTVNCHSSLFSTNATDPKLHDGCTTCHAGTATPVTLIGSAQGKGVPEANPFNNCYTCHGADYFASHVTVTHGGKVVATTNQTCERCHTGDPIHSATIHQGLCNLCHDLSRGGVLTGLATSGPGTCTTCHGNDWLAIHPVTGSAVHSQSVAMAATCSSCHPNTAGSASGIPTDPADNTVHDGCATCHDSQGRLTGIAAGHEGGADCVTCHGAFGIGVHSTTAHATAVALAQACSSCHQGAQGTVTGVVVDNVNPRVHRSCASCHGSDGSLSGSATGKGGSNDCESCHGLFTAQHGAQDHASTVAMAAACSGCHSGAQGTAVGMTLAADRKHHSSCANCHDGTGALTGLAVGHPGGGDCLTCHGPFSVQHAAFDHAERVSLSSACATCHAGTEGSATGMPTSAADNSKHDDCAQCHGLDGVLIGSAAGHGVSNGCVDCHDPLAQHGTLHLIQHLEATDRGQSTNQACNACHGTDGPDGGTTILDTWAEILAMHGGGNCALCHGSSREVVDNQGHSQVPARTVSDIIAAAANPTSCLACHLDKEQPAEHGFDHLAGGIVSALSRCVGCHTNPNLLTGVHGAAGCTTCHDKTTAPVVLKGSAIGHGKAAVASAGVANTCGTCHTTQAADFLNHAAPDHVAQGLVTKTTDNTCESCHSAADTINDSLMHQGRCAACHQASPGGVDDGTLIGSATGKLNGGTCTTCHASGWLSIHQGASPGIGHLTQVGMAEECSFCHAGAAGEAAAMPVDSLDPRKHQGCPSCHDANGELIGAAAGNLGPNLCQECHGGFSVKHAATDHGALVVMAMECSGCHPAAGNTVDPLNPLVHDSCAQCHGTNGSLIGAAAGHEGGGSCTTCHASFSVVHATTDHSFRVGLAANCADCHGATAGTLAGIPVSGSDPKVHASCSQCHGATGTLTGSASGKEGASGASPNDCATCHGGFADHHAAVNHLALVAMRSDCAGCHVAAGNTVIPGDPKAHHACISCHGADGRLLGAASGKDGATLGGSDGGGDCSVCHGGFSDNHATVDHGSRVAMASECSGCHTASGNQVDPADPKSHSACASCHAANGLLIGSALGHSGGGSCTTCHGPFATIHANQDHSGLVALSTDCSGCHAGAEGTASGMAVGGASLRHSGCATCHGTTGALVSIASGHGGGAECNSCHGLFAEKHAATDHAFRVALATDCADCHTGAEGSVTGIPLSAANNTIHDGCGQCHGATGTLVGSASAKEGASSANPNDCATCHGGFVNNHATVNHGAMVAMQANCAGCHVASGNTVLPGDPKAHQACSSCHQANGRLLGAASGKDGATLGGSDGGGDCALCHGGFSDNHQGVDHGSRVAMAGECSGCHTAVGNQVNPTDPKVHSACASCHALSGALIGSALGHSGGGDCATCHGPFAAIHAGYDHSGLVALSTDCSGCHAGAEGMASGIAVGGSPRQHGSCASCHGGTGALVSIAVGHGGGAECNSCHGLFADKHAATDHAFRVALAVNCADCHGGSEGSASGIPLNPANNRVHDTCNQCHGATGALSGSASGKEGASSVTPNDCTTCHNGFAANHAAVNHATMVAMQANCTGCHTASGNSVFPGDPKAHQACASCHQANGRLTGAASGKDGSTLGGSDGGGDCALCHGGFVDNHQQVDHGSRVAMAGECSGCHTAFGNTVDPVDPMTHSACASCHTTNGALRGSAVGHGGGGNCTVCHGGFATIHGAQDHAALVQLSTDCTGCHAGAEGTASGMPVAGSPMRHSGCASCHGSTGALVSIAVGHGSGAECNTCHGPFATTHATTDHSFRVALTAECGDCHTGSEGSVGGMAVDSGDPKKHDGCTACHGLTGILTGSATGKEGATTTTPNTCATCHGSFTNNHAAVNHDPLVAMHDHCSGCHTATANTVDPSDPRVHDACASCHGADGRLVNQAAGHDGGTTGGVDGGGDCTVCHGEYLPNHQSVTHDYRSIYFGGSLTCSGCHTSDATVLGSAGTGTLMTQDDVNSLHSRPTGDECGLCHYYDAATQANPDGLPLWNTVRTAIVNGTNATADATCLVCHGYNETASGHWNQPPTFNPTTFSRADAVLNIAYGGQTIAGAAVDPEGDPITYSKVSGPAWLTVAADGTLGGTPTAVASDSFVVRATAYGGSREATLNITVLAQANQPPAFNPSTFAKPDAIVSTAYTGQTIAGAAVDPEGDAITYAKVSGPAWLTVAANGTLSGVPTVVANDSFVVRATATGGASDATLTIAVVPAVAILNNWANLYSGAPTASPVAAGSFTVASGSQRLLLVAVVLEHSAGGNPTISATYGGTALTQIGVSANMKNENVWLGFLNDSQIGTGAKALAVSYSGAIGTVNGMHVKWASFSRVNQGAPFTSFSCQSVEANTVTFVNTIDYVNNGMTVAVAGNAGNSATGTLTATPAFGAGATTTGPAGNGHTSRPFTTARHTASGSYPGTTAVSWTGTTGAFSALGVVSLQP